jgi:membrane-associated phospholipid phosphatase
MNENIAGILTADEINPISIHGIYLWGVELIRDIQVIENPALTAFMKFFTSLGAEYVYILVALFVLWCVDEKKGFRLGALAILSAWVNSALKFLFKQPRPYDLDPLIGRAFESSYGIPSGHAQLSLVFWFLIAWWYQGRGKGAVRIAALFFTLAIGFTRLYLGVHFPTDLLAGWLLGGITLVLYFLLEPPLTRFFTGGVAGIVSGSIRLRIISAALIVLVMNALHPQDTSLSGLFLGIGVGYNLMLKYVPFFVTSKTGKPSPGPVLFGLRYLLGLAGAALVYLGLRAILPGESSLWAESPFWGFASPYYELGRFLRYGLLGLWAALGAPWVFTQIDQKIASRSSV